MKRNSSSKPPTRAGARNLFVSKGTLATFIRIGTRTTRKWPKKRPSPKTKTATSCPGTWISTTCTTISVVSASANRASDVLDTAISTRSLSTTKKKNRDSSKSASVTSAREKPSSSKRRIRIAREIWVGTSSFPFVSRRKSQPCTRNSRRNCATCATAANSRAKTNYRR